VAGLPFPEFFEQNESAGDSKLEVAAQKKVSPVSDPFWAFSALSSFYLKSDEAENAC
jgi:hypothetical protein